ncbi:efflux RND transporter periplasmic adaptor subunit [Massilia sp. GCM10020059]|uniref:Efflux RND transporter periplasmic adaptor subunit n=1 Tax=Massilia agrisoli TaxID=2892444 RepID=A0ABS8J045_9BURK|nr:efflux RND transporter periplasmic adaptor subunit [Massilia agrisoli]MCC6073422.1 efflux RND transporter periplasmic adaptor subunit [Massilia agrisoli]
MKLENLPPAAPSIKTVSKKRWRAPVIAVAALAIGGAGWYAMQPPKPAAAPVAAKAGANGEPKVDVYELSPRDVASIAQGELRIKLPLSGSLTPLAQATVKSKVSGVVTGATIEEGTAVTRGQVLARLDQADQRARVAQQQAVLDEANARLDLAVKNNTNSEALLKQSFISQNSFDATSNAVALARASVKAAQAQLDLARNALNDTVIVAPMSGVISKRHVQAGEKLSPDMPVFSIVDLRQLTLEAQVPASDIPQVKVGQEVAFRVDGYQDRSFSGKVARINPTTEAGSRSMMVYISVANADAALRGGMFAKGSLTTTKSAPSPLLPLAALRKENNRDVVYTLENGKVVSTPVTLGLRNEDDGMAEVTGGLAAGARVLVAKLDGVKPGSKVKVDAPATKAALAAAAGAKG